MEVQNSTEKKLNAQFAFSTISDVERCADFFVKNVHSSYISHGEVQSGRASNLDQWVPNLKEIMIEEFREISENKFIPMATRDGALIAMAVVTVEGTIAVLEDIIVSPNVRNRNLGSNFYEFIENFLRSRGVKRIFLESGIKNEGAHSFFKRHNFKECSINMSKSLDNLDAKIVI